jgi:hypothetical protein
MKTIASARGRPDDAINSKYNNVNERDQAMTQSIDEALKSLRTAAIDALKGHEAARHDAEGKGMTPLFKEMIAIHTTNAAALAAGMRAHGEGFDDHGSVMSNVNKTIMDVRSLFGGLGDSVPPSLIDGEKRNVHQYEKALASLDLTASLRPMLTSNLTRLHDALARMAYLAAQSPTAPAVRL